MLRPEADQGQISPSGPNGGVLVVTVFGGLKIGPRPDALEGMRSRRSALLLARLLTRKGLRARRDDLAVSMWPDVDISAARRNLRQAIFGLRQALENLGWSGFRSDDDECWLDEDGLESDYARFKRPEATPGGEALMEAIRAYQGPFLGQDEDEWAITERQQCERRYLELLGLAARDRAKAGDLAAAIVHAREATRQDPFNEDARYLLIRLHLANREFAAAKQEYADLAARLRDEFGLTPARSFLQLQASGSASKPFTDDQIADPPPSIPAPARKRVNLWWALAGIVAMIAAMLVLRPNAGKPQGYEALIEAYRAAAKTGDLGAQAASLDAIAEQAHRDAHGPHEKIWTIRFEVDIPDAERTIGWAVNNRPGLAVRLAGRLERFGMLTGQLAAWNRTFERVLEVADQGSPEDRARFYIAFAFAMSRDDPRVTAGLEEANQYYREQSDLFGEGQALRAQGFVAARKLRFAEALKLYEEALGVFRTAKSDKGIALTQVCVAITGFDPALPKELSEAKQLAAAQEALDRFLVVNNEWGIGFAGSILADRGLKTDLRPQTRSHIRNSIEPMFRLGDYARSTGNMIAVTETWLNVARIAYRVDDRPALAKAVRLLAESSLATSMPASDLYLLALGVRDLEGAVPDPQITPQILANVRAAGQRRQGAGFDRLTRIERPADALRRILAR